MVLVVSLIFVSMSLMIGMSAFQNSYFEESSSGSQRSAALALMAAEFGAAERVAAFGAADLAAMPACGGTPNLGGFNDIAHPQNETVGYHYHWCKSPASDSATLTVKGVTGGVERMVEALYVLPDGFALPPINFPGHVDSFEAPSSGSLIVQGMSSSSVDGGYYPAITTNGQKALIEAAISEQNLDNYFGGISDALGDTILADPTLFYIFVSMLRDHAIATGNTHDVVDKDTPLGTLDEPQVTFANSVDIRGNNKNNGAGILVVSGDYGTSGTPDFDGLVIVLGENFDLSGGGSGGVEGSVIVAPMPLDDSHTFEDMDGDGLLDTVCDANGCGVEVSYGGVAVTTSGGGNASFTHHKPYLGKAFDTMPQEAKDFWNFNNISAFADARLGGWKELVAGDG